MMPSPETSNDSHVSEARKEKNSFELLGNDSNASGHGATKNPFDLLSHASNASEVRAAKCPFDHLRMGEQFKHSPAVSRRSVPSNMVSQPPVELRPMSPISNVSPRAPSPLVDSRPTFVNPDMTKLGQPAQPAAPQMVFTGPVFIGYPIEQAVQFMQHFQQQKQ